MALTEEQIVSNWNALLDLVKTEVSVERRDLLLKMLAHFEDRMSLAPASAKDFFHSAWPGGLVDHTLRVIDGAKKLKAVWETMGAPINFSNEELVVAGIFHDFAKAGDMENEYYIPNESEWHRTHQGKIYEMNPKVKFMYVTDRVFFLCMQFGIKLTENEFLAIRLADGMYAEINKGYLMVFDDSLRLKTNLPHIIHHADMLAARIEYDQWKNSPSGEPNTSGVNKKSPARKKTLAETVQQGNTTLDPKLFDKLFEDKNGGK